MMAMTTSNSNERKCLLEFMILAGSPALQGFRPEAVGGMAHFPGSTGHLASC